MKYNELFGQKYIDKVKRTQNQKSTQLASQQLKTSKQKKTKPRQNHRLLHSPIKQNQKSADRNYKSIEKASKPLLNAQNVINYKKSKPKAQINSLQCNIQTNRSNSKNQYSLTQMHKMKQKLQLMQRKIKNEQKNQSSEKYQNSSIQKTQIYAPYPTQTQSEKVQSLKTKRFSSLLSSQEIAISLPQIKSYVRKILEQLKFEKQKIFQIIKITNCQKMFQRLTDYLSKKLEGANSGQNSQKINKQDESKLMQYQMLVNSQNKLKLKVQQLLKNRKEDIQTINILQKKLEAKQTQIFQIKQLIEQTQTSLLKATHRNRKLERKIMQKSVQCEQRVNEKMSQLQQMDLAYKKLRLFVEEQARNIEEKQVKSSMLMIQLSKWQRQYVRLRQRYFAEVEVSKQVIKRERQCNQETASKLANFGQPLNNKNMKDSSVQNQIKNYYDHYTQIIDNLSYKLIEEQERSQQIHIDFLKQKQRNRSLSEQNRQLKNEIEQLHVDIQFQKRNILQDQSFKRTQTELLKQELAAVKAQYQNYRECYLKNQVQSQMYLQFQHGYRNNQRAELSSFDLRQFQSSIAESFKSFT